MQGRVLTVTLLLAGIALNSFAGAGIGLMTFLADEEQLRSLTFWLLGGFGGATWRMVAVTLPVAVIGGIVLFRLARPLNVMSLGESEAYHLGVSTESLKRWAVLGVALTVGAAVSAAGGIGFVGLVVPHLIRLMGGAKTIGTFCPVQRWGVRFCSCWQTSSHGRLLSPPNCPSALSQRCSGDHFSSGYW